jgi:hypothetical protein
MYPLFGNQLTNVVFEYGKIWKLSDLPPNSIALDGAVQGPELDPANRRYSFDHHAGCIRMVTLSTCQQVMLAMKMGLVIDTETQIYINDIDGDTVAAVWLLTADYIAVGGKAAEEVINRIGFTDAHGPTLVEPHPVHRAIAPPYGSKEPQSKEMLWKYWNILNDCILGGGQWNAGPVKADPIKGFGWKPMYGWSPLPDGLVGGFKGLYDAGYLAGVLYTEAPGGTWQYTIGKKSDLVPLKLGPAEAKRGSGDALNTILGHLFAAELSVPNTPVTVTSNWGGATSIGGSPRMPDGGGSRLKPVDVFEIVKQFRA